MTGRILICTTDDTCPEHGKYIYFCPACQDQWAAAREAQP